MVRRKGPMNFDRRKFLKRAAAAGVTCAATDMFSGEYIQAQTTPQGTAKGTKLLQSACPYCGVGCGTLIQVQDGKVVGMVPDKKHPTNRGIQCIKGLNAHEPIYVDRLVDVLVRKDIWEAYQKKSPGWEAMTSATKGSPKGELKDDFAVVSYEKAEEFVAEKLAYFIKKYGGNSVGLNGSGQLTMEAQWIENQVMKGVVGSNSIEANARMCMTSAVAGYFHSYGSDAPPTSYEDIEQADFITFWGHNAREAHPILFWRVADHKKRTDIPTLVSDPRTTGTVAGLEAINPENSYHLRTLNGDISYHNAIAHVLLTDDDLLKDERLKHACMSTEWLEQHTNGFQEYIDGVKSDYWSPENVVERLKLLDGDPRTNSNRIKPQLIRDIAYAWAEASVKGRERGVGGVLTFWGIGYNQMLHGQHNTIGLINLHLLTGNVGRPGCGSHSQTGQPNAMSERLMGGLTGRLPFNMALKDTEWRDHIAQCWGVTPQRLKATSLLKNDGMVVGMMERALKPDDDSDRRTSDPLKAMLWMYTTHIHMPDVKTLVRPALKKMFVVVQDIYTDAPNNYYADVVFPAATWGEWTGGTYIQSERRIYICDGTANPPPNCRPDMDMAIDKGKALCKKLGLDADKVFPYKKTIKMGNGLMAYDPEDIFRTIVAASKGSDADVSGILELEKEEAKKGRKLGPYEILRRLRGVQWPAPNAAIARKGGTPRRYLGQEGWPGKPLYGAFRHPDGKARFKLCNQSYEHIEEICGELMKYGNSSKPGAGPFLIDDLAAAAKAGMPSLLHRARDMALPPELPHLKVYADRTQGLAQHKQSESFPFWLSLGIVYEHFHTAKTIRGATTLKLVPEQYVEVAEDDADRFGLSDGQKVRIVTRRGSYEARVSIGVTSMVRPARSQVFPGLLFSPWNLSVADDADPDEEKNKWLVNRTSHRAWDPVSGQADFKKLAARIEII